jgi:4-amino-4-deoxy-L-arabinose transferase-like glycosyltransferase
VKRSGGDGELRKSYLIWVILVLALAIRLYTLDTYGLKLTINSDDQGYIHSAIRLVETGQLTYRGPREPAHFETEPTVKIMPGQPVLLASVFLVFGTGTVGLYATKVVMILIGLAGIYGIYLLGRYIWGEGAGLIGAFLLAISIQHIVTDTLLLTETPFMTSLIYMVYFSVRLAHERKAWHFYALMFFYIAALMFRATVALYPVILLVYLLLKKYPFALMKKQVGIAAIIMLIVLMPWWVRNYIHYQKFIPLTAGEGHPLLMGTYQGEGYPNKETLDQAFARINKQHEGKELFVIIEAQKALAKERMAAWWKADRESFIRSYGWLKPKLLWKDDFYWIEVFDIKRTTVKMIQPYLVWAGMIGWLVALVFSSKGRAEVLFIALFLLYFTALYSVYFVFGRYNTSEMPFMFLGTGAGLFALFRLFSGGTQQRRVRH